MQLVELLEEYARRHLIGGRTRKLHELVIRQFARVLLHKPTLEDLSDANLALYAQRRLERKKAAATVAGDQCKLIALWRFAAREGYVQKWPTIKPIRVPERIPRAWTQDELVRLFKATDSAANIGSVHGPTWWKALLYVLWDTGERIEAAMLIEWSGVDLKGCTILIPAESRKGKTTDRLYKIAPDTAAWLDKLPRDYKRPFFFPYCLGTVYNRLTKILETAGLPSDRWSKFHRIRRSTASHYEAKGGNATEFLGHSSRKVTRGYLDPRIVKTADAVDLLFRPIE